MITGWLPNQPWERKATAGLKQTGHSLVPPMKFCFHPVTRVSNGRYGFAYYICCGNWSFPPGIAPTFIISHFAHFQTLWWPSPKEWPAILLDSYKNKRESRVCSLIDLRCSTWCEKHRGNDHLATLETCTLGLFDILGPAASWVLSSFHRWPQTFIKLF